MTNGTIVAQVLDDKDLFEGMQVAVYDPFNAAYVEISKLSHIVKDQWITDAGTKVKYDWELHEIVIVDSDLEAILRDKDWKIGIKLLNQNSNYEFNALPFKEGHYHVECQYCNSHFEASRSQALCESCCYKFGTATLLIDQENKPKKFKPTKEKSIPLSEVKAMLSEAFDAGRYSKFDFEDWIFRQNL